MTTKKKLFLDIVIVSCLFWDLLKSYERQRIILSAPDNDVLLTLQWVLVQKQLTFVPPGVGILAKLLINLWLFSFTHILN